MLSLPVAVALAAVPGRARVQLVPRLRECRPDALAASESGSPSLASLLRRLAPEAGDASVLAPVLERRARRALDRAVNAHVRPLVYGDPAYPALLAAIHDPPLVLWTRSVGGEGRAVAIVGARAATPAGRETARWLARDLAAAGIVVVSGLARGIDAAAHEGAVEGGRSIGVLGSGVDVVYPPEHRELAARVAASGGLLSEFPPGTPPLAHHFPLRNRIISGLCLGVVVVEAADRSGSLITARCALDQGRDVMAVPGPVLSGRNRGAHGLLRDGARLVESAEDVLDEIGVHHRSPVSEGSPADGDPLLACLQPGDAVDLDALAASSGMRMERLLVTLTDLELRGMVERTSGGRFVRAIRKW